MKRVRGGAVLYVLLALILVAAAVAAGVLWHDYSRFVAAPLAVQGQEQTVEVARGTGFKQIVHTLREQKFSAAPALYWRVLAWRMNVVRSLGAGEYTVTAGMTPRILLEHMANGKVLQYPFTLVDGWTFDQVRAALAKAPKLKHDSADLSAAQIMQRIGTADENPEGRFLPETYAYVKGDTDLSLLKRARQAMHKELTTQWQQRASDLPFKSPYQALIMASLVEKETARGDERERIAGVFTRRLQRGMLLQTDPAVIYGMGDKYHGDITWKALRTDTPYNTYINPGLPPTPIAMPGSAAIHAALHPAAGKALYFVARGDGSGRHIFSATLSEHNRAVACYRSQQCKQ